ncbi:DUF6266 family protein, partial [Bacteroides sp.]|uniref:DUF6266 family protein n=1 Tax=Bacteroides sp. TaxID=29523 RepID=UPI0025B7C84F
MGIINQGILGGFSGKVGPIVGFHWKSNYYIRARAAKVSNPRTPKQQEQRGKFATAFSFLKAIKPFIRIGYKEFTQDKSAFNAAMSYTLKRAVTGSVKEIRIDFDRALVSMGTLMPIFEGTATQNGNKMHFNWQDNSGMGNAEDTDIAMLLVYNKDKETAVYNTEAALRSDCHAWLQLPEEWQDDELIAYLSFCSTDGNTIANSIRLSVSIIKSTKTEIETQANSSSEKHTCSPSAPYIQQANRLQFTINQELFYRNKKGKPTKRALKKSPPCNKSLPNTQKIDCESFFFWVPNLF